jgi:sugar phosphate isomerase/epimerase
MLALSTSWQSGGSTTAGQMLAALTHTGIKGIELSYRISENQYQQMKRPLKRSGLKVVSVHNYFPIPAIEPQSKDSEDWFMLSSPQKEQRQNAIRYTAKTIQHASDLGAVAVVLHGGAVEMNHEMRVLYQYVHSHQLHSKDAQIFIRDKRKELDFHKPRHLDGLLASLERLVPVAEKHGILLGLENRYHYHELPGPDDFRVIFEKFKGAPIGYWHDTGHAHANEILGLMPKTTLLQNYADQLIGVHLHDAVGLDDHSVPGSGEIDFAALKPFLKADTVKVIELKPGIPTQKVLDGIQFVKKTLSEK